jgi:Zn-dependent protease
VALAGPLMNFFVAFVCLFIMALTYKYRIVGNMIISYVTDLLYVTAIINIGLGAFNLIPIPPLDGSKVVAAVLPSRMYFSYMRFEMYGSLIIILLLYMGVFDGVLLSFRATIMDGMMNIVNNILGLL